MRPAAHAREPMAWAYPLLVTALVAAPYATVRLEYRLALQVQAASILGILLAGAVIGLWRTRVRSKAAAPPRWSTLALSLYGAATLLGAAVGLAAGNDRGAWAGQLLSMALLPLAALVGWLLGHGSWRLWVRALPAVTVLAAASHLVYGLVELLRGRAVLRLSMGRVASVSEIAPMALLMALAGMAAVAAGRRRWLAAGIAVLVLYVVGSGTRGAWLILPPCVLLYSLLAGGRAAGGRRAAWVLLLGSVVLLLGGHGLRAWLEQPRPQVATVHPTEPLIATLAGPDGSVSWTAGARPKRYSRQFRIPDPGTFRLTARVVGGKAGSGIVMLRLVDREGEEVGSFRLRAPAFQQWRRLEALGAVPPGTRRGQFWLTTNSEAEGSWRIDDVRLERVAPIRWAPLLALAAHLERRLSSLTSLLLGRSATSDASMDFRLAESEELLGRVNAAPFARTLVGHGLGATFTLPDTAPAARRTGARGTPQNYIHNYYLFLLFKLGAAGTALVLGALALIVAICLRLTLACEPGPRRAFLAAATCCWTGYAVLALSTPAFLDFRLAPLWGLLLAAVAGAALPGTEDGAEAPASEEEAAEDRPAGAIALSSPRR